MKAPKSTDCSDWKHYESESVNKYLYRRHLYHESQSREIQKLKKELYTIIADHSHTDFDKVWADSDRDYWMTAQEAKEYGMIDEVLIKK